MRDRESGTAPRRLLHASHLIKEGYHPATHFLAHVLDNRRGVVRTTFANMFSSSDEARILDSDNSGVQS